MIYLTRTCRGREMLEFFPLSKRNRERIRDRQNGQKREREIVSNKSWMKSDGVYIGSELFKSR